MAMKMATLRCGVVIVLSLVAGSTPLYAQYNQNSVLKFQCGDVHSYPIFCNVQYIYDARPPYDTIDQAVVMPIDFNFLGKPKEQALAFTCSDTSYSATFLIDTALRMIRNLIVNYSGKDGLHFLFFDDWDYYTLYFGSLPFLGNLSDSIRLNGNYSGTYRTSVTGNSPSAHVSGSDSGETSAPIILNFPAPVPSLVSMSVISEQEKFVVSYFDVTKSLLSSFTPSDRTRELTLFDQLGVVRAKFDIPSRVNNERISATNLPPGCYFARLGDQVAKFVVPPR